MDLPAGFSFQVVICGQAVHETRARLAGCLHQRGAYLIRLEQLDALAHASIGSPIDTRTSV